nr:hypothetical protein CFP56_72708 [Quercus suber]
MEDEGEVIRVGSAHRERMLEECSLSLLGKFLTSRSFNQHATMALLRSVWKLGSNVRIVDVGDGVFQFKFTMESQLKWVLANGPWSFEDRPSVLCKWERGMTVHSIRFNSIPTEVDTHVRPSHGRVSLQSDREKVSKETNSVGGVIGQKHDPIDNGVSVGGPSKGGAMFGAVEKAGTVALAEKSPPDFEAIISELDKAIHSEPIISNTSSVRVEQLEDKRDFYSGLVEIEVMDADSSLNKQIPIVKNVEPCTSLCLQEVACNFNVGKGMGQVGSDPKVGRPKRNATKTKDAFHNVHGPSLNDSGGVTFQKSTSEKQNLLNVAGIGLKKGTWKRAQVKPRTVVEMPLYTLPGPKRSNKEILCETEKADGAKKKTKGNRNEVRCGRKRKDGRMLLHLATQYLEKYRFVIVSSPVTNSSVSHIQR